MPWSLCDAGPAPAGLEYESERNRADQPARRCLGAGGYRQAVVCPNSCKEWMRSRLSRPSCGVTCVGSASWYRFVVLERIGRAGVR